MPSMPTTLSYIVDASCHRDDQPCCWPTSNANRIKATAAQAVAVPKILGYWVQHSSRSRWNEAPYLHRRTFFPDWCTKRNRKEKKTGARNKWGLHIQNCTGDLVVMFLQVTLYLVTGQPVSAVDVRQRNTQDTHLADYLFAYFKRNWYPARGPMMHALRFRRGIRQLMSRFFMPIAPYPCISPFASRASSPTRETGG